MELKQFITGILKVNKHLKTAILASLDAGKVIMNVYNSDDFAIETKADESPLTKADKLANDVINAYLRKTEIPIISEENKQTSYAERAKWSQCWVVDPVDGTKEFIKRNGEFTVNIALVEDNKPVLGVVYVPVTKTIYFADVLQAKSFKAVLNSHDENLDKIIESAIALKNNTNNTQVIKVVGSRSHMSQETLDFVEEIKSKGKEVEIVSKGSSLKFCLVAEGEADIYPRFAPTMEWDTAAGQAVCNAIEIDVISNETNSTLLYNKENLLNPWFICK